MPKERTFGCHCGATYKSEGFPRYNDMCETCNEFVHTCLNCKRWNAKNRYCNDPSGEPGRQPETKNYCGIFAPLPAPGAQEERKSRSDTAKDELKKLFGD